MRIFGITFEQVLAVIGLISMIGLMGWVASKNSEYEKETRENYGASAYRGTEVQTQKDQEIRRISEAHQENR
ncbi:hypothetical protein EQG49_07235 [Periweissella cryptocerci]|uniref:Uncharacterized protein n=1 Tax=Periweissella cryptocerci TaxID=2506420 RepID=A0A4P6YU25_9LACO|nr:hypothetical protein [Periweissella cryptocerci]QBO36268.1 hypothetical protein EQG49_07235 [Periweissella cryptocerci]